MWHINMIEIWHYGNTGVRSPARIPQALKAYANWEKYGSLKGRTMEIAFEEYLRAVGVVPKSENKSFGNDGTYGRKFRFVFFRSGFIFPPNNARGLDFTAENIGGTPCLLTPLGEQLLQADTDEAVEEVFLRSASSPIFELGDGRHFSPLKWVLVIILKLRERTGETYLTFPEFAVCVQTTNPLSGIEGVVDKILSIRIHRNRSQSKREFDKNLYLNEGRHYSKKAQNFREYADTNLRYMRLTGLFKAKGKGIELKPEKLSLAQALTNTLISAKSKKEIFKELTDGPTIPTDDISNALESLENLMEELKSRDIEFITPSVDDLSSALAINRVRRTLERILRRQEETEYALAQKEKWREISDYMEMLIRGRERMRVDDEDVQELVIPHGEAPAYLEWSLWRAILALDHLKNLPYEVRNFNVDSDCFPRSTAAGGMPDLVAEFEDCTLVIEVTLSTSSRQQAMEGSPVRKHVADLAAVSSKPVYGLFIANSFDPNTIDDFHRGVWYGNDRQRYDLHIVPLTLKQFKDCFDSIFARGTDSERPILTLMRLCDEDRRNYDLYGWQEAIKKHVSSFISGA